MGKLARGVAAAHDQGIVHRDLKPRNAVLDGAGEPKVTDFGPAKRGGGGDLTRTQAVVGTPAYMAPEQAAGRTKFVGPEADVYALGVILYECLAGRPPFEAEDPIALTMKVVEEEPPPLSRFVKGVSRDPETICRKCLRKAPHERYAGAAELADDLGRFVRGEPIAARPPGPLERASRWVRRNRVVAGATAVVLALVTGAAVSLAFGLHTSRQMRK